MKLKVWLWALYRGEGDDRESGQWEYTQVELPHANGVVLSDGMVASRVFYHLYQTDKSIHQVFVDMYRVEMS